MMLPRGMTPPPRPRMTLPRAMTPPCAKGRDGNPPAGATLRCGSAAAPAAKKQAQFPDGRQPANIAAGRDLDAGRTAAGSKARTAPGARRSLRSGGSAPSVGGSVLTSGMTGNAAKAPADEAGRHQEALIKDDAAPEKVS